jgi:hypothetical protein
MFKWQLGDSLLSVALNHLTLGRAALHKAILESCGSRGKEAQIFSAESQRLLMSSPTIQNARSELDAGVNGLRRSSNMDDLPRGLLTRAWLRFLTGARTGSESAQEDLDEVLEITERGPMRLFMADIHLHRARLFFHEKDYPWRVAKNRNGELVTNRTPKDDLDDAEYLINTCGYHRRDEELLDAKREILGKRDVG